MLPDLSSLANILAGYDYEANRARTQHADRSRQLTQMGGQRRRALSDSFADRGMVQSGVNLRAQSELGSMMDTAQSQYNQALADKLANIGRNKIQQEVGFNIGSLMPR